MLYKRVFRIDLRKVFLSKPKKQLQRKNIFASLNTFLIFRNSVSHVESNYWSIQRLAEIHQEIVRGGNELDEQRSTCMVAKDLLIHVVSDEIRAMIN